MRYSQADLFFLVSHVWPVMYTVCRCNKKGEKVSYFSENPSRTGGHIARLFDPVIEVGRVVLLATT